MDFCVLIRTWHHEQKKSLTVAKFLIFGVLAFVPSYASTTHWSYNNIIWYLKEQKKIILQYIDKYSMALLVPIIRVYEATDTKLQII